MKRSKGFTLIELLTVIAILAVILLISTPTILGLLEKAKKNTFKEQLLLYIEELKQEVVSNEIGQEKTITWTSDIAYVDLSNIQIESSKYTGIIKITRNNGKYTYTIIDVHGDGYKLDSQLSPNEITIDNIVTDDKTEVKEYEITNMVVNGSFENGILDWTLENAEIVENDNCYHGTKCLHFLHDNGNDFTSMSRQYGLGQPILNHKYYGVLMFKSLENFSTFDNRYEWYTRDAPNANMVYANKGNSTTTWKKYSNISYITGSTYLTKDYTWQIRNFIRGANGDSYTDSVMLIDLTETFGSGNEPSKEWCDKNISYFDGTVKIYK